MRLMVVILIGLLLTASGSLVGAEMRGLYVFGHEVRSLQLCGNEQIFWVQAPVVQRQQLKQQYHRIAKRPYEAVYVELEGDFSELPASGFAADYDGTILVREVRLVSRNGVESCGAGQSATAEKAVTYVFMCGQQTAYTVRATETKAWLFHPNGTLMLPAVPAGQGTRYSDGAYELWIEGQQAQFGESGSELQQCRNDPRSAVWEKAKLDGADFRAVGNEPGWNLEILEGSRVVLITDYGASRVELSLPQPAVDREARITRWDAGELVVEVIGRHCLDSMSGEPFETTVVVSWGGQTLRGCGRALH